MPWDVRLVHPWQALVIIFTRVAKLRKKSRSALSATYLKSLQAACKGVKVYMKGVDGLYRCFPDSQADSNTLNSFMLSFSSSSATLLKEKLTFPDNILLMY